MCDLDCGLHGRCVGETCQCDNGWGSTYCNTKLCDARCNEHGQCKNGTCLCVTGWNGKHCTIEGCPASCSNHGQCRVGNEGLWECRCYDGWDGGDCSVALETNCNDNKDNDKGLYCLFDFAQHHTQLVWRLQFLSPLFSETQMAWLTAKIQNVARILHVVRASCACQHRNQSMYYYVNNHQPSLPHSLNV